jgi:GTP cyclohydrolase I
MSVWLIDMGYVVGVSGQRFKIDYIKSRRQIQEWLGEQPTSVIFNSIDPKRELVASFAK